MRRRFFKVVVASATIAFVLLDAGAAMAQVVQSDADTEPGTSETTQLVTSSTEVRRAVIGLVVLAVVGALLTALYWYKTGQQARDRYARQYGGRHRAGQAGHELADERGQWTTEGRYPVSTYAEPAYAATSLPYPDAPPSAPPTAPYQPSPEHSVFAQAPAAPEWDPASKPTWPPTADQPRSGRRDQHPVPPQ